MYNLNEKALKEKYLVLLDKQIAKLSAPEFDLDAWKSSASYLLSLIFGSTDPKIKEIDKLKIDYSSWALRDSSSTYKPLEACKKVGKEIMEIAKDELDLLEIGNQKQIMEEKLASLLSASQYEKFIEPSSTIEDRQQVIKGLNKSELINLICELY